jgi:hypothetical protein
MDFSKEYQATNICSFISVFANDHPIFFTIERCELSQIKQFLPQPFVPHPLWRRSGIGCPVVSKLKSGREKG